MEEEAEKLKELQNEVEKQMNLSPPPGVSLFMYYVFIFFHVYHHNHPVIDTTIFWIFGFHFKDFDDHAKLFFSSRAVGPVIMSIEEKMEADGRSIYVGNVSKK